MLWNDGEKNVISIFTEKNMINILQLFLKTLTLLFNEWYIY